MGRNPLSVRPLAAQKLTKEMKLKKVTTQKLAEEMNVDESHIRWLRANASSDEEIQPYYDMLAKIAAQKDMHKTKRVLVTLPEDLHSYVESTGNFSGKINDLLVMYLEKIDADNHGSAEERHRK